MLRRSDMAERLAAEALIEGADGYDGLDLLPALCHRYHFDGCRREVLRRADMLMSGRRDLPRG